MMGMILAILICVSIILLVVTVLLITKGRKKINLCTECIGTIVGFHITEVATMQHELGTKSPVVSYVVNGQVYEFVGNFYSTNMKVGQEVKVLYNKVEVHKASIKTSTYFAPIITGILTACFVLADVILAIVWFCM